MELTDNIKRFIVMAMFQEEMIPFVALNMDTCNKEEANFIRQQIENIVRGKKFSDGFSAMISVLCSLMFLYVKHINQDGSMDDLLKEIDNSMRSETKNIK